MKRNMAAADVRQWLGMYLLVFMSIFGGVLLLAGQFLPMENEDVMACFQIMVPFLAGQVLTVSRYFTGPLRTSSTDLPIPAWLVKLPLFLVSGLLSLGFLMMLLGGLLQAQWVPSPEQFKGLVTFSVTILTVTSVAVISKYFEVSKPGSTTDQSGSIPVEQ